jgi:predicted transcriptional regulator
MELNLSPVQRARLARLAKKHGRDESILASEILGRALEYEDWFIREVEKGIAQLDRGEFLTHEEVKARIERRLGCKL